MYNESSNPEPPPLPVIAWLLTSCDSARPATIARIERSAAEVAAALHAGGPAWRGETLAAGLFLEYCRDAGIAPLECHYLLGDAADASAAAVLPYCVEVMLGDAQRKRGPSPDARPAPGRAAAGTQRPAADIPARRSRDGTRRDPHAPPTSATDPSRSRPAQHPPRRREHP